jgi:hypothetical protein
MQHSSPGPILLALLISLLILIALAILGLNQLPVLMLIISRGLCLSPPTSPRAQTRPDSHLHGQTGDGPRDSSTQLPWPAPATLITDGRCATRQPRNAAEAAQVATTSSSRAPTNPAGIPAALSTVARSNGSRKSRHWAWSRAGCVISTTLLSATLAVQRHGGQGAVLLSFVRLCVRVV